MGVLNVTPDSFSGDGLLALPDPVEARARPGAPRWSTHGADLLDIGGASSRPGPRTHHRRGGGRASGPGHPRRSRPSCPTTAISIDTTSPAVAAAAIEAGAHLLNDVWGVADDPAWSGVAAERGVPIVLMHNRAEARYRNLMAEVVADLQRALERALDAGVPWDHILVDPGFGFGKTPDHNLALLAGLGALRVLGRPILLGTSRKSTLGKLLDLAARPARGGDRRDDGAGHCRGRRHRPRPRRARERPHGARRGCDPARVAPGRVARRSLST